MGKDFYSWTFKTNPKRWDSPIGHHGVDDFIKKSLELFEGLPLKIIDLGCGNGRTLNYIYRPEWELFGIDYIPEALVEARKILQDKVTLIQGDMTETHLPEHSFDVVYSCGSFEHMDFPNFDEPARLLKQGGLFLCTVSIGDRGKVETEFCLQTGTPNWGKQWEWELPKDSWIKLLNHSDLEVIYSNDSGEFVCQGREKNTQ